MATRIYKVKLNTLNGEVRNYLVEATSYQQAERHVAKKFIESEIAKPQAIVEMMTTGSKVERANDDQDTAALPGVDEPDPAVIRSNRA